MLCEESPYIIEKGKNKKKDNDYLSESVSTNITENIVMVHFES